MTTPDWIISTDQHTRTFDSLPFQLQVVASTHGNTRPGIPSGHVSWTIHFKVHDVGEHATKYILVAWGGNGDKLPRGTGITNRTAFVQRLMDDAQAECVAEAMVIRKDLARLVHAWRVPDAKERK